MTSSTSTNLLPDINVWLPLAYSAHPHHQRAQAWGKAVAAATEIYFCRITQLGLLRLLTQRSVMGQDVLTLSQAWQIYDGMLSQFGASFLDEAQGLEAELRRLTTKEEVSTKEWSDSYLVAFGTLTNLTLVTFDQALAVRTSGSILLTA